MLSRFRLFGAHGSWSRKKVLGKCIGIILLSAVKANTMTEANGYQAQAKLHGYQVLSGRSL